MTQYVHLVGAEQAQQAGAAMRSAAADMQRAANQFSESLLAHQRFMDDWLVRLDGMLSGRIHDLGQAVQ